MTIFQSKMDFLSANSRFGVRNGRTYLPQITRETCTLSIKIGCSIPDLTVIDLSRNSFENFPEDLFRENILLQKVIMEKDSCSTNTLNRTFPDNFFRTNENLETFKYSVITSSCDEINFPPNFFSSQSSSLRELRISQTQNLEWDDIHELLHGTTHLEILDLTGNDIRCQFHQHFKRGFCIDILAPKKY
jgi:hypothetical protein